MEAIRFRDLAPKKQGSWSQLGFSESEDKYLLDMLAQKICAVWHSSKVIKEYTL